MSSSNWVSIIPHHTRGHTGSRCNFSPGRAHGHGPNAQAMAQVISGRVRSSELRLALVGTPCRGDDDRHCLLYTHPRNAIRRAVKQAPGFSSCQVAQLCPTQLCERRAKPIFRAHHFNMTCLWCAILRLHLQSVTFNSSWWGFFFPMPLPPAKIFSDSTGFLQALTCRAGLLWYCSLSKHLHLFHKFNPFLSAIRRKCRSFSD